MTLQAWPTDAPKRLAWLGVLLLAFSAPLQAQPLGLWVWTDAQGRMVYSDKEPPPNISPSQIVQKPGAAAAGATPSRVHTHAAATTNPLSPRESVRRHNCLEAQSSLTELRGRKNWIVEDEHGTRQPMDEGMRRAESARLRQIMRDNCTYAR